MEEFDSENKDQEPEVSQEPVEGVVKVSLRNLRRRFVLMHKTQIKIWKAMLITVFVAGFASALVLAMSQDWFEKIFGAPGDIIENQAFVTYQDTAGNSYSSQSNLVRVTEVEAPTPPPPTALKIRIKIEPEEKTTNFSVSNVALYIYQAGTTVSPVLQTTIDLPANGELEIDATSLTNRSYDLKVKVPYHLTISLKDITFSGSDLDLRGTALRPKAGNLQDNDNVVNSLDWAIMSVNWASADPVADINGDGMVNTLDWGLMNKNWLEIGT